MGEGVRLSGLQRQVLHFYRSVLRQARIKPENERSGILQYARAEFERNRHADRKNYQLVEHLLRQGKKKVELWTSPGVSVHVSQHDPQ
eukprot:jgi/Botrbrau1/11705/Bobra.0195s0034.1